MYTAHSTIFIAGRSRHTRCYRDWSSDVCSSDLERDERQQHDRLRTCERREPAGERGDGETLARAVYDRATALAAASRSEERRVGKGGRWGWVAGEDKKNRRESGCEDACSAGDAG